MLTRRLFLVLSAASLGAAACSSDSPDGGSDAEGDAPPDDTLGGTDAGGADDGSGAADIVAQDASPDADDATTETGVDDSVDAVDATEAGTDARVDAGPVEAVYDPTRPVKGPWTMVVGATAIKLRVETATAEPLRVTLTDAGGSTVTDTTADATTERISLRWPPIGASDHPDIRGDHTLHDVLFTDLTPGETYTVTLASDVLDPVTVSFRAPPAPDQPFRAVWVADTMWPESENTGRLAASQTPDLFLHGGDIQYFSNPFDTWNGYFAYYRDVFSRAPAHHAIGNHEYEDFDEYESHFVRLFGGQGEPDGTEEYFAFSYGCARFIFLNSEIDFGVAGSPQSAWAEEAFRTASEDASVKTIVVVFHRPYYSFGKSRPNLGARAFFHDLCVRYGGRIVLTGHNHGYERFDVDGVAYIVDAGGGAILTDVNEIRDEIERERPDEIALRVIASRSYGATTLDFAADGTITATRLSTAGDVIDSYVVPPIR